MKIDNDFERGLLRYLQEEQLERIQAIKIGIAGCGGLGSNCAMILVRSGFKRITIVDFDTIEVSNLNRQNFFFENIGEEKVKVTAENLRRINPDVNVQVHSQKISAKNAQVLFADCDIIIEALDKPDAKVMLVEQLVGKKELVIAASGLAGYGGSEKIQVHKMNQQFYVIGDLESGIDRLPPMSPKVMITAAKQADIVLEYVLKKGEENA